MLTQSAEQTELEKLKGEHEWLRGSGSELRT